MQINKTNNVIFLKNLESNIIQEAFVILKDNIKFENYEKDENCLKEENTSINILKEAEFLINQEINNNNLKYEKYKLSKLEKKIKTLKLCNILCIIAFIIFVIIK